MPAEIWRAMHVDEVGQEAHEITRGEVVLKDGVLKVTGLQILKAKYESPLKAFISIRLNGILTLYGFRILKQGERAFLLPPQRQGEMRYLDIVEIEELPRKRLEALVLKLAQRLAIIIRKFHVPEALRPPARFPSRPTVAVSRVLQRPPSHSRLPHLLRPAKRPRRVSSSAGIQACPSMIKGRS